DWYEARAFGEAQSELTFDLQEVASGEIGEGARAAAPAGRVFWVAGELSQDTSGVVRQRKPHALTVSDYDRAGGGGHGASVSDIERIKSTELVEQRGVLSRDPHNRETMRSDKFEIVQR